MAETISIIHPEDFDDLYFHLASHLLVAPIFDRGEVHAQKLVSPLQRTRELTHLNIAMPIPPLNGGEPTALQEAVKPNLPWAEDQFWERVGGEPLNPPPSHEWWPYAVKNNEIHRKEEKFSHTYPERFWPRLAGTIETIEHKGEHILLSRPEGHWGIRFRYGDLEDLIEVLKRNHRTRQAYLPIWFPEDLAAARQGERVPCTLGYHFLMTEHGLDITYPIRSCDFVRHFRDDVYMAARLCQYVGQRMLDDPYSAVSPGLLIMNIGSLHIYDGDRAKLDHDLRKHHARILERSTDDDFGAPV